MRFIRPMNVIDIIRGGFAVWKLSPFRLSLINLPGLLTRLFLSSMVVISVLIFYQPVSSDIGVFYFIFYFILTLLLLFLLLSLNYVPNLAMVTAASNAVLGRPVSVRQAYRRVFSWTIFNKYIRIMLSLWGFALVILIVTAGIVSLIYYVSESTPLTFDTFYESDTFRAFEVINPVLVCLLIIIMDMAMFLLLPVLMLEKRNHIQTIRRVLTFLREYIGHVLLTYLLAYFAPFALPSLLYFFALSSTFTIVIAISCIYFFYSLFFLVFSSVGTIVMILSYYNLRARKEHYDEEVLAEEMGYRPLSEMIVT